MADLEPIEANEERSQRRYWATLRRCARTGQFTEADRRKLLKRERFLQRLRSAQQRTATEIRHRLSAESGNFRDGRNAALFLFALFFCLFVWQFWSRR